MNLKFALSAVLDVWRQRARDFDGFLRSRFSYTGPSVVKPPQLLISHQCDGNVKLRNIGGMNDAKWRLVDGILHPVDIAFGQAESVTIELPTGLFLIPSYLFCFEDSEILLSERFSNKFKHRMLGVISPTRNDRIEWVTLWISS